MSSLTQMFLVLAASLAAAVAAPAHAAEPTAAADDLAGVRLSVVAFLQADRDGDLQLDRAELSATDRRALGLRRFGKVELPAYLTATGHVAAAHGADVYLRTHRGFVDARIRRTVDIPATVRLSPAQAAHLLALRAVEHVPLSVLFAAGGACEIDPQPLLRELAARTGRSDAADGLRVLQAVEAQGVHLGLGEIPRLTAALALLAAWPQQTAGELADNLAALLAEDLAVDGFAAAGATFSRYFADASAHEYAELNVGAGNLGRLIVHVHRRASAWQALADAGSTPADIREAIVAGGGW